MSKKKGSAKKIIAAILSFAIIITAVGGIFVYNKNEKFKSKVNNILKIEQSSEQIKEESSIGDTTSSADSAELANLKQQLAVAEEKLALVSNKNLIMNSNFRINQRESNIYTRDGEDIYTADRWYLSKGNGSFNVTTKTLTGADETSPTILCQWIEDTEYLTYGKPLTVSVTINGERMCFSTRLKETYEFSSAVDTIINLYEGEGFVVRIYVKPTSRIISLQFLVENGVSITLEKIKLEISEYATKYEELQLHEELLECSRYYQELLPGGAGYALNDTTVSYTVPLAVPLRTMRNLVVKLYPKVIVDGVLTSTYNIMSTRNENNAIVLAIKDIFVTKHQSYVVVNGTIFVDAEFYVDFTI